MALRCPCAASYCSAAPQISRQHIIHLPRLILQHKTQDISWIKEKTSKISDWRQPNTFKSSCKLYLLTKVRPFKDLLYFCCCMEILLFQLNNFNFWTLSTTFPKHKIACLYPSRLLQSDLSVCQESLHCDAAPDIKTTLYSFFSGTPQRAICSTICLRDAADIFTGFPISISQISIPRNTKRGFLKDSKTQQQWGNLHAKTLLECQALNRSGTNSISQFHMVFVSRKEERKMSTRAQAASVWAGEFSHSRGVNSWEVIQINSLFPLL